MMLYRTVGEWGVASIREDASIVLNMTSYNKEIYNSIMVPKDHRTCTPKTKNDQVLTKIMKCEQERPKKGSHEFPDTSLGKNFPSRCSTRQGHFWVSQSY